MPLFNSHLLHGLYSSFDSSIFIFKAQNYFDFFTQIKLRWRSSKISIQTSNRLNYFIYDQTIIEEHIIGIPADAFMQSEMPENRFDRVRLAKEFVKFNERCFVRLLGDMHSGNFVVNMTRDFEKWHYRMRAIDFDQQSYHWKKKVYLPQFYQQNLPLVKLGLELLDYKSALQYQKEERALISQRVVSSRVRLDHLLDVMTLDPISKPDNVRILGEQLAEHYQAPVFAKCTRMGELVRYSLEQLKPVADERDLLRFMG